MKFTFTGDKPIYLQIAQQLEDAVFLGIYPEESQIPSTTELSVSLSINPATVLKGMNLLVEEDIIYKKRGLGMFVKSGAKAKIKKKRNKDFYKNYILPMLSEAEKLGLSDEDVISLLKEESRNEH